MKKKKQRYSLTAKERRQQYKPQTPTQPTTEELEQHHEAQVQKKNTKNAFFRVVAVVVAAVIAVTVIIAGTVLLVKHNAIDNEAENPVATITLKNGSTIKMTLLYKESVTRDEEGEIAKNGRAAIMNLIYLAENKFYDGTIFTNNSLGFIAMEGYTEPTVHKAGRENEEYVESLKGFYSDRSNKWNETRFKLGYRVARQTIISAPNDKTGYVAMLSGTGTYGSSTGYIMMHREDPQRIAGSTQTSLDSNLTYIAKMDADSVAVLLSIAAMASKDNTLISKWTIPEDYDSVRIKTVRISNLDRKLKKKILNNFHEYVLDRESTMEGAVMGATSSWQTKGNGYS